MKIKFTLFNQGQEHYMFDTNTLTNGEELEKFLINIDEKGKIYVVPMISYVGVLQYPHPPLEKL